MLDVDATFLPMHIAQVALWRPAPPRAWAHATLQAPGAASSANETRLGDVTLYDDNGKPLVGLTGLLLKRVTGNTFGAHTQPAEWLYEVAWRTQSLPATATMLADPQIAADAASAALPALQEMVDLPRYYPQMNDLDALATAYAVTALHALGWEPAPGQRVKEEALAAQLAIAPAQRSLFARWLQHLAADGLLRATDGGWHVVASLPSSPPSATRVAEMAARYPEAAADIELTRRCGEGLAAVLRGEADPLHLLFPDGSLEETERLYRTSPWARVYTHGVAEAIAALAERGLDRPLCVLEIGGGTGGTTSAVLPRLAGHEVEYQFTDISPFFLARAQERFSAYPFVSYKPLDIERSPLEQGFVPHSVDCVIAANVIHATADLRATLANVRTLLAPGGVLILQEMTQPLRWIDLTFGMTEGWWRFTDRALRPGYALLNRAEWLELLADAGFEAAVGVPQVDAGRAPEDLPYQSVLVAQMPAAQARGPLCIFADDGGLGEELRALALAEGRTVVLVRPGSSYLADGDEYQVNPLSMEEHERLLHETGAGQAANGDIVYLWALDEAARLPSDSVKLMQIEERLLGGALNLTRALARSGASARLWIVTRGAQAVGGSVPSPLQATLWGFGKSVAREHDELQCTLIDLDVLPGPVADPVQRAEAVHLQHEFDASTCAQQIALRAGERMEARLAPLQGTAQASSTDTPVELVISARGSLDNLRLQPAARRTPDAQEVEIRVEAAALNFKDVLNTLGMYPGDPGQPGSECAGEVVAVGSTVTGLQPGDKVVALAPGCMRSYVTVHTNKVALRPPHLTAQEAITLPIAYITAAFALEQVGQMQRGERVLIHAAAGGVGMAAVRLALQGGLTVFATAGSPAKQDFVRALGVEQVFDSRTLDFADGVLAATNGQGVDLVLNSLAGDFATASLRTLAAGGRFLELGKRDLLTDTEVAALERPIDYHVIDWGETAQAEPELIHRMLVDVMDGVGAGRVTPLPLRTFPLAAAVDAFRTMAQARHIGKIVLTVQPPDIPREQVRSNATYLITGGLGGLGLVAAKWLVAQGARSITLMGRHAPGADAQAVIEALAAEGAQITVVQGDVASADDVRRALHAGDQTAYPLRGVIHAAGVLDDGALTQQSWARFAPVLAPKVQGAWNLHQQTADLPLDFFVFYSSIASLLGSPGQSNHAAANSFMSALAHVRRAAGQPGLSIDWGAWSAVGAAVSRGVDARVGDAGMGTIAPDEGMELLRLLLQMDVAEAAVLPMEWGRYLRNWAGDKIPPFFAEVASLAAQSVAQSATAGARLHAPAADTSVDESAAPSAPPDIVQQLASASPQRRKALLLDMVRTTAGRVLALPTTRIDDDAPLSALGLDSLMAVELRNLLGSELVLARRLPATLAFDYPSVAAIAGYLATELGDTASPAGAQPNEPASPAPVGDGSAARSMLDSLDSLEELSDAEVERLLAERMTGA
jgi:NADPH:quinone reductase-like Zn-dependent oxidoreductase/SAM-dependent methyltransferase/acyl carrier protein